MFDVEKGIDTAISDERLRLEEVLLKIEQEKVKLEQITSEYVNYLEGMSTLYETYISYNSVSDLEAFSSRN